MSERAGPIGDEDLVAYLDGELSPARRSLVETRVGDDPAVKARLAHLGAGDRPFADAFDAVLQDAPSDRLRDVLAKAARDRGSKGVATRWYDRRLAAIAAAILLFVGGTLVGTYLPDVVQIGGSDVERLDTSDGWRAVVAEYLALYTRDTLADIPTDSALRDHELAFVGDKLSLELSADQVALPDLVLKRAQILALGGKPLAQIVYLSADGDPVAFCITEDRENSEQGPTFEIRQGKNIVYWSKAGYNFMLIGDLPRPQLTTLATSLAGRVT